MLGARVHINGVLVPNTEALLRAGGDGQAAAELGCVVLTSDCRIVFGRRHFFRLDVHNENHPASGSDGRSRCVVLVRGFPSVVKVGRDRNRWGE